MITEKYRKDYDGEFVISKVQLVDGKKTPLKEWIPNTVEVESLSKRAVSLVSTHDVSPLLVKRLENHKGGVLNSLALNVYTTDNMFLYLKPKFHIETNPDNLKKIITLKYDKNAIIYTNGLNCINHPGKFHLIPYGIKTTQEALTVWMACFDGNQEIFLLGHKCFNDNSTENSKVNQSIAQVMKIYSGHKFYHVTKSQSTPDCWKECLNLEIMPEREFISYCDIN